MPTPKDIKAYGQEWSALAQELHEKRNLTFPCESVARAKLYRLKFYGFRAALQHHDPDNPWLNTLLCTNVRCPDDPPRIIFAYDEIGVELAAMLGVQATPPVVAPQPIVTQEEVLAAMYPPKANVEPSDGSISVNPPKTRD